MKRESDFINADKQIGWFHQNFLEQLCFIKWVAIKLNNYFTMESLDA